MIDIFGPDLAVGYDIGCRTETTINNTPLLGEKARENNHRCLVGAFHGTRITDSANHGSLPRMFWASVWRI